MKLFTALLFLVFTGFYGHSQSKVKTDNVAGKFSCNANCNISELHLGLINGTTSDLEKVRAFYIWIANNINYDVAESNVSSGNIQKQQPANVLKSRKAVCHGYSVLFNELCKLSGIKCNLVSGYHRQENEFNSAGHTWNVVYVNGKWQQVDVTWGAGGITNNKFYKEFSDKYFLQDPTQFLAEHYPFDPMWQLLNYPVTLKNYKAKNWIYKKDENAQLFNFNDTISSWEKLDSLDAELNSAVRMKAYNPGDKLAGEQLGYALINLGNREFKRGNEMLEKLYGTKSSRKNNSDTSIKDSDKYFIALDSIETVFNAADKYYGMVSTTNTFDKQIVQNNRKALDSNIQMIRKEKARVR